MQKAIAKVALQPSLTFEINCLLDTADTDGILNCDAFCSDRIKEYNSDSRFKAKFDL